MKRDTKYAHICACFGMSVGAFPDAKRAWFASAPDAERAIPTFFP